MNWIVPFYQTGICSFLKKKKHLWNKFCMFDHFCKNQLNHKLVFICSKINWSCFISVLIMLMCNLTVYFKTNHRKNVWNVNSFKKTILTYNSVPPNQFYCMFYRVINRGEAYLRVNSKANCLKKWIQVKIQNILSLWKDLMIQ